MMNLKDIETNKGLNLTDYIGLETPISSRFKEISRQNKNSSSDLNYDNDDYLSDLLNVLKIKTVVVGVGGAGNNTVSRLNEMGVLGTETLNINTDAHDLYYSNSKNKVLIGKDRCKGLGSGNNPSVGFEAAKEDSNRLHEVLKADIVFLTCGLGGGTGTGAAPIIAREAKKNNALVVTFCSIPFMSEGSQRRTRAKIGLKKLAKYSDSIIPIPNDNLLKLVPTAPILTCFKVMDEVLVRGIKEVVNLVNSCGLINIDFADVRKILEKSSEYPSGLIGITETMGGKEYDLIQKSKMAIHNPLLNPNTNEVESCLISVSSNHKLSLSNVDKIVSTISHEVPPEAKIKFGTSMDPNLEKIRIMVLGKGPISPYVRSAVDADENIPFE